MTQSGTSSAATKLMSSLVNQRVDDKSRWIVPTTFRVPLGLLFTLTIDSDNNMVAIPGPLWETLREYMVQQRRSPGIDERDIDAIERTLTFAVDVDASTNGFRVPIPELIREMAELKKDIVTVGNLDRVVVWDREKFLRTAQDRYSHPETLKRQRQLLWGPPLQGVNLAGSGDANGNTSPSHPGDGG